MRHPAALVLAMALVAPPAESGDARKDAVEVAPWLSSSGRAVEGGRVWPFEPEKHRTWPGFLQAQTGYLRGAARAGLWFLRLHAFSSGEQTFVVLPDSPFGS